MKRTTRILALVFAILMCLTAYGCNKPSKNEALDVYREMYPKARQIDEYIYGRGLPYDGEYNPEELSKSHYVPVNNSSPYKTAEELKAAILEVYTEEYYENTLRYVLFDSLAPDEQGYTGSAPPRYKELDGVLHIDVSVKGSSLITCNTEKAYIVELKSRSAIIGAPREGQTKDKSCYMVLTEKGWRFDLRVA